MDGRRARRAAPRGRGAGRGGGVARLLLGAFGDPGHAFPMLALGRALVARGHAVTFQTWERWRADVEAAGMAFSPAPEYQVFPTEDRWLKPYQAVVRAARDTRPLVQAVAPDAVVADILTLAPALAAELEGVPVATLVPHVHPAGEPGWPPYAIGARLPRTPVGRALWSAMGPVVGAGLRRGRAELNATRERLGLAPLAYVHGGISRDLCLVGTFPQLEYPRDWPPSVEVVGPLLWEPPSEGVEPPPGDGPVVLVAPSTSQDPDHRLLRAALEGLADAPVRAIATWNRRLPESGRPLPAPPNARVVEWLSYARTMPRCDLVICHGGHGTVVRSLACGVPVLACPAAGDMNENAARIAWAGAGVRLPRRLVAPRPVRLGALRALESPRITARAHALGAWAAEHDGAARAAELVEAFAAA